MAPDEAAQTVGNREGHHEMMAGKLAVHLSFKPLSGLEVLAGWAMAVATRTVKGVEASTWLALEVSEASLLGALSLVQPGANP